MPAPLPFLQVKKDGKTLATHKTAEASGILENKIQKPSCASQPTCDKNFTSAVTKLPFSLAERPLRRGGEYPT